MNVGFSQEFSEDVFEKGTIITSLSKKAKIYFDGKEYGSGAKSITIGFICVHPDFDFFFKERKKYIKSKKILEYDIKLDYEVFKNADEKERLKILKENVFHSLKMIEEFKIEFKLQEFKKDLLDFFSLMVRS